VEEPRAAPYVISRGSWATTGRRADATEHTMQIPIIAMNFLYAILGVVLMYATYRVIDMLTPQVDFHDELKKGNIAVAIFLGSIFIAIGMIVGRALN
jgi:putative membrane protein